MNVFLNRRGLDFSLIHMEEIKMTNTKRTIQKNMSSPPQANVMNTFSFRLTYALAIRKMSQVEFAKACGMAPSNISQYVNKNATPRIEKLKIIAEKLGVSELWLIGDGAPADIDNKQGLDALSADERTFLTIYRQADWEGKKFLLDTAKIFEIMKKNK